MPLTESQTTAVAARGNVIVVAGAGTGKTSTLVERCLDVIREGSSLDRVLMVTFTEAAATEMRHRLRVELQELAEVSSGSTDAGRFAEQLALVETAKISTIHSFCLRLVQAHFHELGLDPDVKVLDDQQCRLLTQQTLDVLMEECYSGKLEISESVRALIATYAPDWDEVIRDLLLKLHRYTQSLPDPANWLEQQQATWAAHSVAQWAGWLGEAFTDWRRQWLPALETQAGVQNIVKCISALNSVPDTPTLSTIRDAAAAILDADGEDWNGLKTKVRKPLCRFFDEAAFLLSVTEEDALKNDRQSVSAHMGALLTLTTEFTERFTGVKRELGGVDFPDLEQLTLRLLLNVDGRPSEVAREWQARMDYVFVDECQDINGAQDAILSAVSRSSADANRFLVGDVKQSIYQFRLADPQIFRDYEWKWAGNGGCGQRISLADNFRSCPGILELVNTLFSRLMRESFSGVAYEPLQVAEGSRMADLGNSPCVEMHLIRKESDPESGRGDEEGASTADLSAAEREARLVALRLRELKESRFEIWDKKLERERAVEWRDMAVIMRSPGPRTEVYAKVFHQAGVPLAAERAGFLDAIEVSDLVSLLQLLDNPLQDIPLLAVLRSPLVGLTLDELAAIRAHNDAKPLWRALRQSANTTSESVGRNATNSDESRTGRIPTEPLRTRLSSFLGSFARWRDLVRRVGPSLCMEQVLADTNYDVLLGANQRGAEQVANVRRLLDLARQFDPYLRQGLYRFLKFLKALEDAEESLEPAPAPAREAVRLMSTHKSKGLEFPVVALAGLGSRFNLQDLTGLVLLDSKYGLAPKAMTTSGAGRYPTLPFWLAEKRQRALQLGEELRLLYVAATRARDRLICTGTLRRKDQGRWECRPDEVLSDHQLLSAQCPMDWLMDWLPTVTREEDWQDNWRGASHVMIWELWDPQDERLTLPRKDNSFGSPSRTESSVDPATVMAVKERLSLSYAHQLATIEPAKSSVSALRSRAAELADEEAVSRFPGTYPGRRTMRSQPAGHRFSAAERGTLHHRFLQLIDLDRSANERELQSEVQRLTGDGAFTAAEATTLDLKNVAEFWTGNVGARIRSESRHVRRELPFTARFDVGEIHSILGRETDAPAKGEFVVIQGVVDLAVLLPTEIWLLDFKTDEVEGAALDVRVREYHRQLQLYAAALERICHRPVRQIWLHFLSANATVSLVG